MTDIGNRPVVRLSAGQYSGPFTDHLLEQYKLFVSSAENVSLRRIASNRYLLAISAALVALYGAQAATLEDGYWMLLFPIIGVASAFLWIQIINSHSRLNKIKFELIHELEQHLPATLFEEEWNRVKRGQGPGYKEVTTIERIIPFTFVCVHVIILVMTVLAVANVYDWTP